MTLIKYNSAAMERHFQPKRVQVVSHTHPSYGGGSSTDHKVIIHDVVADTIVEVVTIDHKGRDYITVWKSIYPALSLERSLGQASAFDTKAHAIEHAKRSAEMLMLPFNLQTDILDYADLVDGPQRPCLGGCGESLRSKQPVLCKACQAALKAGQQAAKSRSLLLVAIKDDQLINHLGGEDYRGLSKQFIELLFTIGNFAWAPDAHVHQAQAWIRPTKNQTREGDYYAKVARLTEPARAAMQGIVDLVWACIAYAYADGYADGERFVKRLAAGDLTIGELNQHEVDVTTLKEEA